MSSTSQATLFVLRRRSCCNKDVVAQTIKHRSTKTDVLTRRIQRYSTSARYRLDNNGNGVRLQRLQGQQPSFTRRFYHQQNSLLPPGIASSLLMLPNALGIFGNWADFQSRSSLEDKHSNPSNSNSRILACSTLQDGQRTNFIQRWLQIMKRWFQSLWHACLVTQRISEVVIRMSPLMILAPTAKLTGSVRITEWAWNYTINAMQSLGPVAIKFCQWAATRRDIFPPELCDNLGILHDRGCPHSWQHTDVILKEAFGDDYDQQLTIEHHNDDNAAVIGCGCAAQVYKGRITIENGNNNNSFNKTKGEDRVVAIKVLHPNFTTTMDRDLELIQIIAKYLHALPIDMIRMLNLPRAVENFSSTLRLQADLTMEAQNLETFRTNFYGDRDDMEEESNITFPCPIGGWNHNSKVLVEDYVHDAVPISTYLQDSTPEGLQLRRELAGPLLRAFLKMVFIDNFVHGDLHPGNVLVKTDIVKPSPSPIWKFWSIRNDDNQDSGDLVKRSIVFLDAGIANSLSPEDTRNLRDLFKAVIFNEGYRAGELMVERAKYERCSNVPGGVDAFATGVQDIVSEFHDRRKEGLTLGAVRIGGLLSRVLDLCRVHGVEIDPSMVSVVLSTLVLEGLGRSLAPELDLISFSKPFVLGLGKI